MAITLEKVFFQIADYVNKHESNYTIIEDNINTILLQLGGATGSLGVPVGLQEIFDRDGVIGVGSYQLTNQTVVSDTLTIPAGAVWANLNFAAKATTTNLDTTALATGTRYIDVDSGGFPSLATTSGANSVYSFEWDSGTKIITVATLLIDILFDGDDYQAQLTSIAQAKTFTTVAARLEDIEGQLGVLGSLYAQDADTTTGLTFGYQSGVVRNDNVMASTIAGTIAMTDATTNYVEVNPSTGTITKNTSSFTSLLIPLFEVTTAGAAITGVVDQRTWASLGGGGGGGGGHAQNTDVGTSSAEFQLNRLEAGTPTLNGSLSVERGTSPNVDVRWNETTDTWEFTNDGTIYSPIGAPDLGLQELTKTVIFEIPPAVIDLSGHTTDSGWVEVDLTADPDFTSIVSGVQGMILRVQYQDDAPDATTEVLFRRMLNASGSEPDAMRVYATDSADYNADEGHIIILEGEGYDMSNNFHIGFDYLATTSGSATGTLKVFVIGYYEKVTGAGTQDLSFSSTGNVVAASTTVQFDLSGFANRALVHSIQFEETTGSPILKYNVKVYSKDTFLAADLLYQVDNIDPAIGPPNWLDTLPWFQVDDDDSAEMHISIENLDATFSGTYDITVRMERFA